MIVCKNYISSVDTSVYFKGSHEYLSADFKPFREMSFTICINSKKVMNMLYCGRVIDFTYFTHFIIFYLKTFVKFHFKFYLISYVY